MTEDDTFYKLQGRKNLYHLSRAEKAQPWSVCFTEAIIAAYTETEARMIHPSGKIIYQPGDPEWYTTWVHPTKLVVRKIGLAEIDSETVVISRWNNT